jgi:hypothetical protein
MTDGGLLNRFRLNPKAPNPGKYLDLCHGLSLLSQQDADCFGKSHPRQLALRTVESSERGRLALDCTPKVRHEIKGQFTLNGGEQWRCPDSNIPAN